MTRRVGLIVILVAAAARAEARTWIVGGERADFPLIAPAIAASSPGDVIRVRRGVYREDLILDRAVSIVGEDFPVLFGTGLGDVIEVRAAGCEIRGLRIEGSGTGQTNQMDAAVHLSSNNNRVTGNRMRRVFYGVVVSGGRENVIDENDIEGLADLPFGQRGDGVYLYRAFGNVVSRNRIRGERDAIYFQYSPGGRAEGNRIEASRYGLHEMFSDGTVIAGNVFIGCAVGANIMNSRRIQVSGNQFAHNRGVSSVGLSLKDCDRSVIGRNQFVANPRGLKIEGSSENLFADNLFTANDTAVQIFSSAERNTFTGNTFRANWSDVLLSGRDSGTRWSVAGKGNRWDGYDGFDFDGDGVGDVPHRPLGPFERFEGSNPATRLFLESPAAHALALAARLAPPLEDDAIDPHPLVGPRVRAPLTSASARGSGFRTILVLAATMLGLGVIREVRVCLKSSV